MNKVIECRDCGSAYQIRPKQFQDKEYPKGLKCIKCWSKPSKTSVKVSTSYSPSKSSGGTVIDKDTGSEINTKYDVGDSVFINTDKYGVLLCQIIDTECWNFGEHVFYTLDAKGHTVEYVEEQELFDSAQEAESSGTIIKV